MDAYRKKPIDIQAEQVLSANVAASPFINEAFRTGNLHFDLNGFVVQTLEGIMFAPFGSYLIRGPKGEYYPCRQDIFEETYETVEDED